MVAIILIHHTHIHTPSHQNISTDIFMHLFGFIIYIFWVCIWRYPGWPEEEMELQAVVSKLTKVLVTSQGSSARATHILNCWAISAVYLCVLSYSRLVWRHTHVHWQESIKLMATQSVKYYIKFKNIWITCMCINLLINWSQTSYIVLMSPGFFI